MQRAVNREQKRGGSTSFGVTIKERTFAAQHTRYQFNGKEYDSETETSYFGARNSDGDLGIMEAIDPAASETPGLSPYSLNNNNPNYYIDPDGRKALAIVDKENKRIRITMNFIAVTEGEGALSSDAINKLQKHFDNKFGGEYQIKLGDEIYTVDFDVNIEEGGSYSDVAKKIQSSDNDNLLSTKTAKEISLMRKKGDANAKASDPIGGLTTTIDENGEIVKTKSATAPKNASFLESKRLEKFEKYGIKTAARAAVDEAAHQMGSSHNVKNTASGKLGNQEGGANSFNSTDVENMVRSPSTKLKVGTVKPK